MIRRPPVPAPPAGLCQQNGEPLSAAAPDCVPSCAPNRQQSIRIACIDGVSARSVCNHPACLASRSIPHKPVVVDMGEAQGTSGPCAQQQTPCLTTHR
jgi:hypothetical protein